MLRALLFTPDCNAIQGIVFTCTFMFHDMKKYTTRHIYATRKYSFLGRDRYIEISQSLFNSEHCPKMSDEAFSCIETSKPI